MTEPSRQVDPFDSATPRPDGREVERDRPRAADAARAGRAQPGQYLIFRIREEEYGVSILRIREILEFSPLTPVPLTPPWIRGVLNLRGSVVPVVDLALKFGLRETRPAERTCIVIIEVEADDEVSVIGVMVDGVDEVVELGADALEEPPDFGTRVRVDYLQGLGKVDRRLLLLLDADRVLSTEELLETRDAAAAEEPAPEAEETR